MKKKINVKVLTASLSTWQKFQTKLISVERFTKLFYILISKQQSIKMINLKCIRRIFWSHCLLREATSETCIYNDYLKPISSECIEISIHIYLQLIIWTQKIHRDYSLSTQDELMGWRSGKKLGVRSWD